MPEFCDWFCSECKKSFQDFIDRHFSVCPECKSRSFAKSTVTPSLDEMNQVERPQIPGFGE